MKIAITGAHRVGKTSLAEKLQEALPGYQYRPEPYYELEERGHGFSETPTIDNYLVQLEYSSKQISKKENNIFFDRCPIDLLAYIQAIGEVEIVRSQYHKVQNVMREIDLLVFVPVEEPDLISCPESELPQLRYEVNDILNDWLSDFNIETVKVSGTISDRKNQVIKKICALNNDGKF